MMWTIASGELDALTLAVCNGPGEIYECGCSDIPAGDCDCEGNQLDALGVCGGEAGDADADGICDDVDDCVGALDACWRVQWSRRDLRVRMLRHPEGDCDCDGNQLDAWARRWLIVMTKMPMASVTMWTTVWASSMHAGCAMGRACWNTKRRRRWVNCLTTPCSPPQAASAWSSSCPRGATAHDPLIWWVDEVHDEQEEFEACEPWMWNGMLLDSRERTPTKVTEFGCDSGRPWTLTCLRARVPFSW